MVKWETAQQGAFADGELIVAHIAFGVCLVLRQVSKKDRREGFFLIAGVGDE